MKAVLITSSILIVLIAALRPLLRGRIDPRVQYALWLAVALRLLIPVNFVDSAYSVLSLLDRAEEPARIVENIRQTTIPVRSYYDARTEVLEEYHRQGIAEADLTPGDLMNIDSQARARMGGPTLAELAAKYARPVWLGGGLVMAAWFLLVNLRLRRRLKGAVPVEADCPLPVYVSDALPSPCLCGVARPAIYVTPAALDSPDRLRHVLAHELTHYRHRDHWWALARCLLVCVYWFDPLVWWAAALSRQDCELACDEGAIRRLGEGERLPYGRTLVDMIAAGRTPLLQTATTMTGGKRRVRERISLIAQRPKTVIAAALALVIVLGLGVGCTFTGAPEGTPGPGEGQPSGGSQPQDDPEPFRDIGGLQKRLMDLPEEFQGDVIVEQLDMVEDGSVRFALNYRLDLSEEERAVGAGQIAEVMLWSRPQFQRVYFGGSEDRAGLTCFARTEDNFYFVMGQPTSAAYPRDTGPERYQELFDAVPEFVRETVLATVGVEPFDPEELAEPLRAVRAVMDEIAYAPGTAFGLYAPDMGGTSPYPYLYNVDTPPDDYWGVRVRECIYGFAWEEVTMEQAAALMEQEGDGVSLMIAPYGEVSPACITMYKDSPLAAVRTLDNEMKWYRAESLDSGGTYAADYFLYDCLRWWFDKVDLAALRAPSAFIPDDGRSHEEIARAWAEGWEGALAKAAPGGFCTCTYMDVRDVHVETDWPENSRRSSAQRLGLAAEDFGKTWFPFGYQTVFIPENQSAEMQLMAGNTEPYAGDDALDGMLHAGRVGYMILTDQGWTCREVGTGW